MTIMIANRTGVEVGYLAATYPGLLGHLYSPGAAKQGSYEFLPYALDKGAFRPGRSDDHGTHRSGACCFTGRLYPASALSGRSFPTWWPTECYQAGAASVDGTGWFRKNSGQASDLRQFLEHVTSTKQI
jgi:hypothetical protein